MRKFLTAVGVVCALATASVAFAEEIVIGHICDITGGTGSVGKPYADGVQAAAEVINAEGGINGKTIKLLRSDYAYKIPEALNIYKKLTTSDKVFAIQGWGTGDTEALTKMVAEDKVVYMSASYSAHLTNPEKAPYNFFCAADYTTQLRAGLKYLKDNWKGSAAPKLAFIFPDVPYGKAPIEGGKAYAKELGFDIVGQENVDLKSIEATTQLLNLKKNEPDFAWVGGTTPSAAVIVKDAKKLGLKTKFLLNIWAGDEMQLKLSGDALEGSYGLQAAAVYGDDVPAMKTIMAATKNEPQMTHFTRGWVSMMVMAEGLKRADKAGELTGPGLKKALETLKDFDTGGLTAPITFTSTDHRPNMSAKVVMFEGGKMKVMDTIVLERRADWFGN